MLSLSVGLVSTGSIVVDGEEIEPDTDYNFATATYTEGGVPVLVSDVLGEDEVNFGDFTPATDITPGEGINNGGMPILVGNASSILLGGNALMLWDVVLANDLDAVIFALDDTPNFDGNWNATIGTDAELSNPNPTKIAASNSDGNQPIERYDTRLGTGAHRAAIKFLSTGQIKWSIDGNPVESVIGDENWAATNPNTLSLQVSGAGSRIARLRLFDVAVDDAELPGLSAL